MAKKGTTQATAQQFVNTSRAGVRNGPGNKNVTTGADRQGHPTAPTGPIKGYDRGGV